MKQLASLVLLASVRLAFAQPGFPARSEGFRLTVEPASIAVSLYEPVEVQLVVTSAGSQSRVLETHGALEIGLTMTRTRPDGSVEKSPGPDWARGPDIFYGVGRETLGPGQAYRQTVLINEWFNITEQGRHTIELGWGANPPFRFSFTVGPRDEKRLRAVVQELVKEAQVMESAERRIRAVKKLRHIPDPVVLPAALQLASEPWTSHDSVELLVKFDTPESVEALGRIVQQNQPVTGGLAQARLRYMRSTTKRVEVQRMIDEILAAAPVPKGPIQLH